jgi:putative MATE family efflux protein
MREDPVERTRAGDPQGRLARLFRGPKITEGPLGPELLRFGLPLALGMALQTTFNLVDAYILAQLPPVEVGAIMGALGICDQIAALGSILVYGLSTATTSMLAMLHGAKDEDAVTRTAWQSLLLIGGLSLLFAVLGLGLAGPIVRDVIGAKGEVAAVATSYLRVIVSGGFSLFFLLQLAAIQRALGSSKTPVALLVGGNLLNLLLAVLFVFGDGEAPASLSFVAPVARALHVPRMGMVGAAWATVVARSIVLLPNVWIVLKRFRVVPPKGARGLDWAVLGKLWGVAWPSSAQLVLRVAAMLFVNSLVARAFTTEHDQTATTALGLVFRLDTMALFVAIGWGNAAQTFVGQNAGAGLGARAKRSGWLGIAFASVTSLLLALVAVTRGREILRIFDDEAAPLALATDYLLAVAPSYLALGTGIVLGFAMSGAGATRSAFRVDAAVILGFQVPVSLLAVLVFGASPVGLFRCVAATSWVSALAYVVVYARSQWLGAVERAVARPERLR